MSGRTAIPGPRFFCILASIEIQPSVVAELAPQKAFANAPWDSTCVTCLRAAFAVPARDGKVTAITAGPNR